MRALLITALICATAATVVSAAAVSVSAAAAGDAMRVFGERARHPKVKDLRVRHVRAFTAQQNNGNTSSGSGNGNTRRSTEAPMSAECQAYMSSASVEALVQECNAVFQTQVSPVYDLDVINATYLESFCTGTTASCLSRAKDLINGKRSCFDAEDLTFYNDFVPAICTMNGGARCGLVARWTGETSECQLSNNRTTCEATMGCAWSTTNNFCLVSKTSAELSTSCASCVMTIKDFYFAFQNLIYELLALWEPTYYYSNAHLLMLETSINMMCSKRNNEFCQVKALAPIADNYIFQDSDDAARATIWTRAKTQTFNDQMCADSGIRTCYTAQMTSLFSLVLIVNQAEYLSCLNGYVPNSNARSTNAAREWSQGLEHCGHRLRSNIRSYYEVSRVMGTLCHSNTMGQYCLPFVAAVNTDLAACSKPLFNDSLKTCTADCSAQYSALFSTAGCCLWRVNEMVGDVRPTEAQYRALTPIHPYARTSFNTNAPGRSGNNGGSASSAPGTMAPMMMTAAANKTGGMSMGTTMAPSSMTSGTTMAPSMMTSGATLEDRFAKTVFNTFLPCAFANTTEFMTNATTRCVFPNVTVRPRLQLALKLRYEAIIANTELATKIKTACKSDTAAAMGVTQDKIVDDRLVRNTKVKVGSSSSSRRQQTNSSDDGTSYEFEVAASSDAEAEAAQAAFSEQVSSGNLQVTATAQVVAEECADCTKTAAEVASGTSAPASPGSSSSTSSSGLVDASASETGSTSGAAATTVVSMIAVMAAVIVALF